MQTPDGIPQAQPSDMGVAGRGVLMGLAEVVPGVSGGTMAFISGIYPALVGALATFGPGSLPMLARPLQFWEHHNLRFLLVLAAGMGLGILIFAQLMHFLLAHYQPLVWAFFSGVIAMSVVVIGRFRRPGQLLSWGALGLLLGLSLLWLPALQSDPALWLVFVGGAVAVCAWLLPAVSGSYVLLALGLYAPVIDALAGFNLPVLATLTAGCALGLLMFAKALAWLLRHYSEALLSLLTGFMLGSVPKLWPWQLSAAEGLGVEFLSPQHYAAASGQSSHALAALLMFVLGGIALWLLSRLDTSR